MNPNHEKAVANIEAVNRITYPSPHETEKLRLYLYKLEKRNRDFARNGIENKNLNRAIIALRRCVEEFEEEECKLNGHKFI